MIYQSFSASDLHPALGEGSTARLRFYGRPKRDFLGEQGGRWAVLICPGGGYEVTAQSEGEPVALAFLAAGMQAFVLDYSVKPARWPQAFLETAASVAFIRARAAEYGIDPGKVAVCGFSAGGHLAGCLANLWAHPVLRERLGLTPEQARPDAAILSYPVVTAREPFGSALSFANLLGEGADIPPELSLEDSVTEENPPTFLWATAADGSVPVENTLLYAGALREKNISFELHIYADGPHAMGLATPDSAWNAGYVNPHAATWHGLCVEWLKARK